MISGTRSGAPSARRASYADRASGSPAVGTPGPLAAPLSRARAVTPTGQAATAVSLTGQLAGGALGRWCAATLTGTPHVAAQVATAPGSPTPSASSAPPPPSRPTPTTKGIPTS